MRVAISVIDDKTKYYAYPLLDSNHNDCRKSKVAEGFVKMCKDMDSKFKVIVALRSAHMHIEIERNFVCSEICMIEIIILSDWTKRKKTQIFLFCVLFSE
jgi:hypothetical protein